MKKTKQIRNLLDTIQYGDVRTVLPTLPSESVDCIVTSPPYWALRNYGVEGQIGLEATPELYIDTMAGVFDELLRVLKPWGVCWLNLGDTLWGGKGTSGAGWDNDNNLFAKRKGRTGIAGYGEKRPQDGKHPLIKRKEVCGIPWMVAFELRRRGWWIRQEIIWDKPNAQPETVFDRCTRSHETVFLLTKSDTYYWDQSAASEPAKKNDRRNIRSVWNIPTEQNHRLHFAPFPRALVGRCIRMGCPGGG